MKILVIDTDRKHLKLIQGSLSQHGSEVHIEDNLKKAVSLVGKIQPELILLAIEPPPSQCIETLRILKRNAATTVIPVIAMIEDTETSIIEEAITCRADDYLIKPFPLSTLA